jgi:hypothetical protein
MLTKEQVTDALIDLPGQFTLDELVDRLIFIQKVEEGLKQSERGEVYYSTEEARTMGRMVQTRISGGGWLPSRSRV